LAQVATLTELQAVDAVMSPKQRRDFAVPSLTLSIVMLVSVVFALGATSAMLIVQIARERAWAVHEALVSKARRLRNTANNEEVRAPPLEEGAYHIFLSHVWGTVRRQKKSNLAKCA
jgi:hypothetical protein